MNNVLEEKEVESILGNVMGASHKYLEDGTRVHVHYTSFGKPTQLAISKAKRAEELELPKDRYTGRVHRVWRSKANDLLLTLWVELERDHEYRTLNATRGKFHKIILLGN